MTERLSNVGWEGSRIPEPHSQSVGLHASQLSLRHWKAGTWHLRVPHRHPRPRLLPSALPEYEDLPSGPLTGEGGQSAGVDSVRSDFSSPSNRDVTLFRNADFWILQTTVSQIQFSLTL